MGTNLLGFSIGRGSGALKGLRSPARHLKKKQNTEKLVPLVIASVCQGSRSRLGTQAIKNEGACSSGEGEGREEPAWVTPDLSYVQGGSSKRKKKCEDYRRDARKQAEKWKGDAPCWSVAHCLSSLPHT